MTTCIACSWGYQYMVMYFYDSGHDWYWVMIFRNAYNSYLGFIAAANFNGFTTGNWMRHSHMAYDFGSSKPGVYAQFTAMEKERIQYNGDFNGRKTNKVWYIHRKTNKVWYIRWSTNMFDASISCLIKANIMINQDMFWSPIFRKTDFTNL